MQLQDWINTAISIATMTAAVATAWATTRLWASTRDKNAEEDPYLEFPLGRTVKRREEYPIELLFRVPEHLKQKWEVQHVKVTSPIWRGRLLAPKAARVNDGQGGHVGYRPGPWSRSLEIPEVSSLGDSILLSNESPPTLRLRFSISLRNNSKSIKYSHARIIIKD